MNKPFFITLILSLLVHVLVLTMSYVPDVPSEKKTIDLEVTFGNNALVVDQQTTEKKTNSITTKTQIAQAAAPAVELLSDDVTPKKKDPLAATESKNTTVLNPERQTEKKQTDETALKKQSGPIGMESKKASSAPALPRSAPRIAQTPEKAALGHLLGNVMNGKGRGVLRYEMKVSLWLDKFRTYPKAARQQGLEGEGVVLITIDRQGHILLGRIQHSTGHGILDDALMQMVRDANPVLPAPKDYFPKKESFSYEIAFRFNKNEWQQWLQGADEHESN